MTLAPSTYFERSFNRPTVKIQAGELHVTAEDVLITTVLGSCVSVCLRDRITGIGGMNHFMLPGGAGKTGAIAARYGAPAMEQVVAGVLAAGGQAGNLEAKVFGAGRINNRLPDIGRQNADFALDFLRRRHIPVLAVDVGDSFPRKICFSPRSGRVFVKTLGNLHQELDLP